MLMTDDELRAAAKHIEAEVDRHRDDLTGAIVLRRSEITGLCVASEVLGESRMRARFASAIREEQSKAATANPYLLDQDEVETVLERLLLAVEAE